MTFGRAEQAAWAREMRERLPRPAGHRWHEPLDIFTRYSTRALGSPVSHWRDLSPAGAEAVLKAARNEYPERRDESAEVWDEQSKRYIPKEN